MPPRPWLPGRTDITRHILICAGCTILLTPEIHCKLITPEWFLASMFVWRGAGYPFEPKMCSPENSDTFENVWMLVLRTSSQCMYTRNLGPSRHSWQVKQKWLCWRNSLGPRRGPFSRIIRPQNYVSTLSYVGSHHVLFFIVVWFILLSPMLSPHTNSNITSFESSSWLTTTGE